MMEKINGKKTYIIARATILYAIAGFVAGLHDIQTMWVLILGALGFGSLRHGIEKLEGK